MDDAGVKIDAPRTVVRALALALALGVTVISGVRAQSTSASLRGAVKTKSGSPVADAVVRARSDATGAVRTTLTDAAGSYRFELLAPGAWTVVASIPGSNASESRSVNLRLQQTLTLDITVAPTLTETVSVQAETPLLDRTRTGGELRVTGEQIDALPLAGRNVTDLAMLDSSVRVAPPGGFYGERGSVFVVNGQSGRSNSFLVDGLDNNDQTSGMTMNAFFSQQVIREFVVLTHQFAPEFGRASGGVLNIVTERGTNEFSGGAFLQGASSSWNKPGPFVSSLPDTGSGDPVPGTAQGGVHFGGPFKKDRAFFFFAYEHQHADEITPFTGVGADGTEGGWVRSPSTDDNFFLKTDYNLGSSNFLMVRLSHDARKGSDLLVGGIVTPEAGFGIEERDRQLASSLTTVVSPDVINEARLLLGTSRFEQTANSGDPGVTRPSGQFGGNNLNHQIRKEDRIQLVDNLTWRLGPQTLKFGVDVTRSSTDIDVRFNPLGNFLYNSDQPFEPGDCGDLIEGDFSTNPHVRRQQAKNGVYCSGDPNGMDNDGDGTIDELGFLDSYPLAYSLIVGEPTATLDDTLYSVFVQSSWQISPSLLLDYGWRYDLSTYTLPSSSSVPSSIANGGAKRDTDNLAPRLGFSWTPTDDGRTIVRGGAGIFYDKLVLGFPAVAAITSGTEIGLFFPQGYTYELTENSRQDLDLFVKVLNHPDSAAREFFFPRRLTMKFSTGTTLDTPYAEQYTLGGERQVLDNGALSLNFTRVLGYHNALMRDLNPPLAVDQEGIPVHRDDQVGSIAAIVTEGRTWYTGVDMGWRWQRGDLAYSAGYTWSRSEDLGPDPLKGGISLPPGRRLKDPGEPIPPPSAEPRGDHARSDSDRRHRIVLSGRAGLPLLGGMGISAVFQAASGVPFNVTTGKDENLDGILSDRPKGLDRNTGEKTPLDVVNDRRERAGLDPVGSLDEPNFAQMDLRIWKPFGSKEGSAELDVFFQVFNLFDRFNAGAIEGRITARNFGEPIGQAGSPRTFEIGIKAGF
jgi:hypothetical protein